MGKLLGSLGDWGNVSETITNVIRERGDTCRPIGTLEVDDAVAGQLSG